MQAIASVPELYPFRFEEAPGTERGVESEPAPEKRPIGRPRNPEVDRLATAIVGRLRGYKQYSVDQLREVRTNKRTPGHYTWWVSDATDVATIFNEADPS